MREGRGRRVPDRDVADPFEILLLRRPSFLPRVPCDRGRDRRRTQSESKVAERADGPGGRELAIEDGRDFFVGMWVSGVVWAFEELVGMGRVRGGDGPKAVSQKRGEERREA